MLASALPTLALAPLALLLVVLLIGLLWLPEAGRRWARGLVHLKWLFLALFVLYLGYTPGEPLSPYLPGLSAEGLHEGLRRAAVLAALLAAVQMLLVLTPPAQLIGALRQLLHPLRRIGIDGHRFALRLALALAAVGQIQQRLEQARSTTVGPLDAAADLVLRLEREPIAAEPVPMSGPFTQPASWQFGLPLLLALLLWWSGR